MSPVLRVLGNTVLPFYSRLKESGSMSPVPDTMLRESDHEEAYDSMHAAAQDLINAVHSKDVKAVAEALRAAFELADSGPHSEGPHTDEE
jgi:hypothetical protein